MCCLPACLRWEQRFPSPVCTAAKTQTLCPGTLLISHFTGYTTSYKLALNQDKSHRKDMDNMQCIKPAN